MMRTYARVDDGRVLEIFETDGDITEMVHPNLILVEIPAATLVVPGWLYANGVFSEPPVPTSDELAAVARVKRAGMMEWATNQIAPLQDAVDLEEATSVELASLRAWKQYRVSLNRLEQQPEWPTDIQWPIAPDAD
ncbi:tail fiber assembly protein [Pseudomonas neuropathica]